MTFPPDDGGARRAQRAARAGAAAGEKLSEVWWAFMLRGILAALLGLVALFWPTASIGLFLRVVGLFLLADGVTALIVLLRGGDRGSGLIHTIISLGTGLALLFLPGTSARAAFVLLGIWALVTGLGYLWSARQMDAQESERSAALTLGSLMSLGGLVLIFWPGTGVVALAWAVAVIALLVAALLVWLALRLKRLSDRLGPPKPTPLDGGPLPDSAGTSAARAVHGQSDRRGCRRTYGHVLGRRTARTGLTILPRWASVASSQSWSRRDQYSALRRTGLPCPHRSGSSSFLSACSITQRVAFLRRYSIPEPATGGSAAALAFWGVHAVLGVDVGFDMTTRDRLLVIFFATEGVNARLTELAAGGRVLGVPCFVTVAVVFLQDVIGTTGAVVLGMPKAAGVIVGRSPWSAGTARRWLGGRPSPKRGAALRRCWRAGSRSRRWGSSSRACSAGRWRSC